MKKILKAVIYYIVVYVPTMAVGMGVAVLCTKIPFFNDVFDM